MLCYIQAIEWDIAYFYGEPLEPERRTRQKEDRGPKGALALALRPQLYY